MVELSVSNESHKNDKCSFMEHPLRPMIPASHIIFAINWKSKKGLTFDPAVEPADKQLLCQEFDWLSLFWLPQMDRRSVVGPQTFSRQKD